MNINNYLHRDQDNKMLPSVRNGFTLIEIIVVISIIGILSAIAIPNLNAWISKYRVKKAARDLYSNMQTTKINAVKDNRAWAVRINESENTYAVYSSEGVTQGWDDGDETLALKVDLNKLPGNIVFDEPTNQASASRIIFSESNVCTEPGNIYISDTKNSTYYRIQITTPGAITLKRWNGTTWN